MWLPIAISLGLRVCGQITPVRISRKQPNSKTRAILFTVTYHYLKYKSASYKLMSFLSDCLPSLVTSSSLSPIVEILVGPVVQAALVSTFFRTVEKFVIDRTRDTCKTHIYIH